MLCYFSDLKQELNIRTLTNNDTHSSRAASLNNEKIGHSIIGTDGICHVETETQTNIGGINLAGAMDMQQQQQKQQNPIKRKLSLALKFARRAFRRSSGSHGVASTVTHAAKILHRNRATVID